MPALYPRRRCYLDFIGQQSNLPSALEERQGYAPYKDFESLHRTKHQQCLVYLMQRYKSIRLGENCLQIVRDHKVAGGIACKASQKDLASLMKQDKTKIDSAGPNSASLPL